MQTNIMPKGQLNKLVQISWCEDGVPKAKKGLFHTHTSTVAHFFCRTHVVISSRNEVHYHTLLISSTS